MLTSKECVSMDTWMPPMEEALTIKGLALPSKQLHISHLAAAPQLCCSGR